MRAYMMYIIRKNGGRTNQIHLPYIEFNCVWSLVCLQYSLLSRRLVVRNREHNLFEVAKCLLVCVPCNACCTSQQIRSCTTTLVTHHHDRRHRAVATNATRYSICRHPYSLTPSMAGSPLPAATLFSHSKTSAVYVEDNAQKRKKYEWAFLNE